MILQLHINFLGFTYLPGFTYTITIYVDSRVSVHGHWGPNEEIGNVAILDTFN